MEFLALFVVVASTPAVTYDAEVLPNKARPPWSFRETTNCSAAVEDGVLHVRDDGTAMANCSSSVTRGPRSPTGLTVWRRGSK